MRILVIGTSTASKDPEGYYAEYVKFFERASDAGDTKAEVSYALFDDLLISVGTEGFSIRNTRCGDDLSEYDVLVLRGTGFRTAFDVIKAISVYARLQSIPVINDYHGFRDSSKLTQAVQFFEAGIPVAQTVYVTRAALAAGEALPVAFPCILKATFGAHGNDNHVVNNIEDVAEIVSQSSGKAFVLQTFVPNDRDYRVLVIGDEVLIIERRAAAGTHLNNTSQGGSATLVSPEALPTGAIDDARRITKLLDMTIAGVDILCHAETGAYYFLEVNSQPQLMSGAFVDEKVASVGKYLKGLHR